MSPNEYKEYLRLGECLFGLGQYKEAQESFTKGLTLLTKIQQVDPNNVQLTLEISNTKVWTSRCLKELGDYNASIQILQSVIKHFPEHLDALFHYAVIFYELEKYSDAFNLLLQILVKDTRFLFF